MVATKAGEQEVTKSRLVDKEIRRKEGERFNVGVTEAHNL